MRYRFLRLRRVRTALVLLGTALLAPVLWVLGSTAAACVTQPDAVAPVPVALVFGAGIGPNGQLSPTLADRVAAAVQLYTLGRVQHLLLSGDNGRTS